MNTSTGPDAGRVIYLDHHAITPVDPRVLDAMLPYLTTAYGNPSSPHAYGHTADSAVRAARQQLRELIGASTDTEVVFTSGATEADHLAITGMARALGGTGAMSSRPRSSTRPSWVPAVTWSARASR